MVDERQPGEGRLSGARPPGTDAGWPYEMPASDEINLYEIWAILHRRRWSMAIVLMAVLLITGVYAVAKEARHEVEAYVEIGEVPGTVGEMQMLAAPESVATRLQDIVIPRVREANAEASPGLPAITVEVVDEPAGLIRLAAEVPLDEAERTRAFMQTLIDALQDRHAEIETLRLRSLDRRIVELRSLSDGLDSEVRTSGSLSDSSDAVPARLLIDALSLSLTEQRRVDRLALEERLFALQSGRSRATPTAVLRPPRISADPVGPGITRILAIGAALGLLLGVFAAFFREFMANAREYREASRDA